MRVASPERGGGLLRRLAQSMVREFRASFPTRAYYFDRPLLILQSDDWGRAGIANREALEMLRSAGLNVGKEAYDFYSLESAEDLCALRALLARHKDASGRPACLGMNFIVHNLNFAPMEADDFRRLHLLPLSDGLPRGWDRPGLLTAYREGVAEGVFRPALHGSTHFCRRAVESVMGTSSEQGELLRTLWSAGTPYIYWRMPWIGYEYWDPNLESGTFLPREAQHELIGASVGAFAKLFSALPASACAPGYRADRNTHSLWAQYGLRVAQNGPGSAYPPHWDENGVLHTYRNIEFEPAIDPDLSAENCVAQASACFERGLPAIVSMHSINLHSSLKDFRTRTLELLEEFLAGLRAKHPNLLYLDDENVYQLVQQGAYETAHGKMRVNVSTSKFRRSARRQIRM